MTTRFIDRESELAVLDASWRRHAAQLLVVLGRRRIGKTALLRHFARRHPTIVHFVATRLPEAQQLAELGDAVGHAIGDRLLAENGFRDWSQVFSVLATGRSRLALVIDEFPYLVDANPALPSLLQRAWDETLAERDSWLALCGSSIAVMERETLDARAPLFGRRTGQLRLRPLPFDAVRQFVPRWGFEDAVRAYGVFGGIPQYLQLLDPSSSLAHNIERLVLAPGAPLRDEVEFLLRQELQDTRVYFGILAAVAAGKEKFGEIVNATHLPAGNITKYLAVLQALGFVVRDVPASEPQPDKSKRGLYRIADPFIRFWFRHVRRGWSRLETGQAAGVLHDITADLDHLAQATYEDLCRQATAMDRLGGQTWTRVGRWWDGRDEIDLLAVADAGAMLVGEVKWSRRAVGTNVLADLEDKVVRSGVTARASAVTYALFSRNGFTPGLRAAAQTRTDLLLVHRLQGASAKKSLREG
jgi:AAA+ ATPase superfamily predicted ATPase